MFLAKDLILCPLVWVFMLVGLAHAQNSRADMPPAMDPGYNAHQETVIYACMGVAALMLVLLCLLLWFLVDRSKKEVRRIKAILPSVVDKLREKAETADDHEDSHGTLRATEFQTGFMTSSSVQDNSLEHAPSGTGRQHRRFHHNYANSIQASTTRDAVGEESANHVGISGHMGSDAPNRHEAPREAYNQIVWREKAVNMNVNSRPANHHRGPAPVAERIANQDTRPLVLQTLSPLAAATTSARGRTPDLAARVEMSVLPRPGPARESSPYAYDNPDMPGDSTMTIHNVATLPQQATSSETKLKYRNSYYESHV